MYSSKKRYFCRSLKLTQNYYFIFYILLYSWSSTRVTQVPFLPALPVRPDLWIYYSLCLGGENYIIKSKSSTCIPLAATSVAINIYISLSLNYFKTLSLWYYFTLLLSTSILKPESFIFSAISSITFFVFEKIKLRLSLVNFFNKFGIHLYFSLQVST